MGSATRVKVIMPKLGLTMEEGTVVSWLKQDGDQVQDGDVLSIIETEKLTHDIEAQGNGQLHIVTPEGITVSTGETIGYIVPTTEAQQHMTQSSAEIIHQKNTTEEAVQVETSRRKLEISPVALRMAQHFKIDPGTLTGSGTRGRIHKADILLALQQRQPPSEISSTSKVLSHTTSSMVETNESVEQIHAPGANTQILPSRSVGASQIPYEVQTVSPMRKRIAANMQESLQSTAQLTLMMEANVTSMLSMRDHLQEESQHLDGPHITLTDIFIKIVAQTLLQHKLLNATLTGDELHLYQEINIGVAAALEEGLLVPVIHHADRKSIEEISRELKKHTEQARNGTLSHDDLAGSTFTITNLGALGVEYFTPILYKQQSGILGIGRVAEHSFTGSTTIEKHFTIGLSLTFDHRVVDGVPAAQFLNQVRYLLEHPWSLLLTTR